MLRSDRGLHNLAIIGTLPVVLLVLGGCPNPQVGFDSPAPSKRLDAIAQSSQENDPESLVKLVEKLGSTDPAERMLAIRALEKREGTTLGYNHSAPKWERLEAIERWNERIGLSGSGDDHEDSPMNQESDSDAESAQADNQDG